jgi:hypothetical protein
MALIYNYSSSKLMRILDSTNCAAPMTFNKTDFTLWHLVCLKISILAGSSRNAISLSRILTDVMEDCMSIFWAGFSLLKRLNEYLSE